MGSRGKKAFRALMRQIQKYPTEYYGTDDWKYVEVDFSPREENKVDYLGVQLVGKGTAWFDDINLEVLE